MAKLQIDAQKLMRYGLLDNKPKRAGKPCFCRFPPKLAKREYSVGAPPLKTQLLCSSLGTNSGRPCLFL